MAALSVWREIYGVLLYMNQQEILSLKRWHCYAIYNIWILNSTWYPIWPRQRNSNGKILTLLQPGTSSCKALILSAILSLRICIPENKPKACTQRMRNGHIILKINNNYKLWTIINIEYDRKNVVLHENLSRAWSPLLLSNHAELFKQPVIGVQLINSRLAPFHRATINKANTLGYKSYSISTQ